jgi:hypothetical protein
MTEEGKRTWVRQIWFQVGKKGRVPIGISIFWGLGESSKRKWRHCHTGRRLLKTSSVRFHWQLVCRLDDEPLYLHLTFELDISSAFCRSHQPFLLSQVGGIRVRLLVSLPKAFSQQCPGDDIMASHGTSSLAFSSTWKICLQGQQLRP